MILVENNLNLLNKLEGDTVESLMDSFISHETPKIINHTKYNFYARQKLPNPKEILPLFFSNLEKYIEKTFELNYTLESVWINKITKETNRNDTFHKDGSDLTVVTYLNDDFIGGEFEYVDEYGENKKIKPKKDLIITSNDKLSHRVLPVTSGVRYSLVCFFNFQKKDKKTLI